MKWRSNWFEQHNYFAILSCYLLQVRVSFINDAFALSVANNFIETVECRLDANSVHDYSINLSALENPKHFSSGSDQGPDGSFSQLNTPFSTDYWLHSSLSSLLAPFFHAFPPFSFSSSNSSEHCSKIAEIPCQIHFAFETSISVHWFGCFGQFSNGKVHSISWFHRHIH